MGARLAWDSFPSGRIHMNIQFSMPNRSMVTTLSSCAP
jgi:hypothetical protein